MAMLCNIAPCSSTTFTVRKSSTRRLLAFPSFSSPPAKHKRYAILGAGFAGMSVAWHLLQHCSEALSMSIHIFDEIGIGGGASGASGGLMHPYSPRGKLLWHGHDCWRESMSLISVAEATMLDKAQSEEVSTSHGLESNSECIVWKSGILKVPTTNKISRDTYEKSAKISMPECKITCLSSMLAKDLIPEIDLPTGYALYFPQAINVHPERYLKGLFLACQQKAIELSPPRCVPTEVALHKSSIQNLLQLSGEYDAIIVCLGAKASLLPELKGKLPFSICRGVVAQLELPDSYRDQYAEDAPSILSDAWLACQGPRNVLIGATRSPDSNNDSRDVSDEDASSAVKELLPKISAVYPPIRRWNVIGTQAGLRATPPQTSIGKLPLVGCIDKILQKSSNSDCTLKNESMNPNQQLNSRYWLFGGLGSRGLVYHGYIGKLLANAVVMKDDSSLPLELTSWLFEELLSSKFIS